MKTLLAGLRWSQTCGHHPGTPVLFALVILGAVAGGWIGALVMAGIFAPMYLYGAWERGKMCSAVARVEGER